MQRTLLLVLTAITITVAVDLVTRQHQQGIGWVRSGRPKILPDFQVLFWLRDCPAFTRSDLDSLYTLANPPKNHNQAARAFLYSRAYDGPNCLHGNATHGPTP